MTFSGVSGVGYTVARLHGLSPELDTSSHLQGVLARAGGRTPLLDSVVACVHVTVRIKGYRQLVQTEPTPPVMRHGAR